MSAELWLAGLAPLAVSVLLLALLTLGLSPLLRIMGWRPAPVKALNAGPGVVAGGLRAAAEPLRSQSGAACVLLCTRYRAVCRETRSSGSSVTVTDTSRWVTEEERAICEALLDDGSGPPLSVDLQHAVVVDGGEAAVVSWDHEAFVSLHPALALSVPREAQAVELHETLLPEGARVMMRGDLIRVAPREDEGGDGAGYRGSPLTALRLGGSEASPLVVLLGGRAALAVKAALPALGVLAIALGLATMGALVLYQGVLEGRLGG